MAELEPEELDERLTEVFSDMPVDLFTDDMAPPDDDDLELERSNRH